MKINCLGYGISLALLLGCSERHSENTQTAAPAPAPAAEKPVRVTKIYKMNFSQGDPALILEYETDIPIDDKQALGEEVARIWTRFQKDVEKAQLRNALIRATYYETTGFLRTGKGFGFSFRKDADGEWQSSDDSEKK